MEKDKETVDIHYKIKTKDDIIETTWTPRKLNWFDKLRIYRI